MRNFNNNRGGGSRGGGKRFGGGRDSNRGSGRDFNRQSMHHAVCDECGSDCEVPFRPTGDKPIYCNNCFQGKRDTGSSKFGKKEFRKPSFDDKKRYTVVCSTCGKSCEVPFKPTEGKPVYCDECFGKGGGAGQKGVNCSKEQFDALNAKLDKILKLLSPATSAETTPKKKEAAKEVKTPKQEKPSKKVEAKKPDLKKVATKKVIEKKAPAKKAVAKKTVAKKATKKKTK